MNLRIVDLHHHLLSGRLTSQQLVEFCLQRIRDTKKLNGFINVCEDTALEAARQSADRYKKGSSLGVLDGIPVAIKDNFSTKNIETTCGSKMLQNYIPTFDATVVDKLCNKSGGILMGKTNLDEYAMGCGTVDSRFGACKNPWNSGLPFHAVDSDGNLVHQNEEDVDDWVISGGSSGGSAVAVATGSCFASLASDTGGSTRNPASHVGVVGFKPSYGLLSRHGLIPLTHSMDAPSVMAKYVDDVSVVFDSIRGPDVRDSTTVKGQINMSTEHVKVNNLRIGIPQEYASDFMSKEVKAVWQNVADLLANFGAKVLPVSLPHTPYSLSCYSVINCCEVASNFACYDGIEYGHREENSNCDSFEDLVTYTRHKALGNTVKGRIIAGNYFLLKENYDKFFVKALKIRRLICEDFNNVFSEKVDFLLTPVTLTPAYRISEWQRRGVTDKSHGEDYCTQPINLAGLPAISLPCKLSSEGLPIGLQITGPKYCDYSLLRFAKILEELVNFPSLIYTRSKLQV